MTQQGDQAEEPARKTDFFVDSGSIRLAVRDYGGAGQPLILVHGGPGPNLTSWDSFAPRLAGQFRAVAYDQRGHGQSDSAEDYSYSVLSGDIQAIIEALALHNPIVVGHSWGGWIALNYAAQYSSCAGVVCVDGPITGEYTKLSEDVWIRMEEQIRTHPVLSRVLDFAGTSADLEELLAWIRTSDPEHQAEFSEAAFRHSLTAGADGLLRSRQSLDHFMALNRAVDDAEPPSVETYEQITCPVLLVMATQGTQFSRQAVEEVHRRYPKLQVEWLDCGHAIQQERPDELAALIADFSSSSNSPSR